MADVPPRPLLAPAELRLLRLLAQGMTEREAAAELHYSYQYTRELAAQAATRLGAKNKMNAVYLAARHRLI